MSPQCTYHLFWHLTVFRHYKVHGHKINNLICKYQMTFQIASNSNIAMATVETDRAGLKFEIEPVLFIIHRFEYC